MAYAVVRTDLVDGADVGARLVSVKFFNGVTPTAIENGNVVLVGDLIDGEREVRKATAPSSSATVDEIAIIATPEVFYDDRLHNLHDFVNEAGSIARGYRPHSGNIFSVTKEAIDGNINSIEKGFKVGIGTTGTKWTISASASPAIGHVADVETINGDVYVAIQID